MKTASIESGAALGFIGAIGACGGYLIPSGFGKSIAITGGPQLALEIYLAFYAVCLALTWWFYLRRSPADVERDRASPKRGSEPHQCLDTSLPLPARGERRVNERPQTRRQR